MLENDQSYKTMIAWDKHKADVALTDDYEAAFLENDQQSYKTRIAWDKYKADVASLENDLSYRTLKAWDKLKSDADMTEDETALLENDLLYQKHRVKMMVGEGQQQQPTKEDLCNPKFKKEWESNTWRKPLVSHDTALS